jgi:hypothetical protein
MHKSYNVKKSNQSFRSSKKLSSGMYPWKKRERKNLTNYKSGIKTYLMHIKK